MTDPGVWDRDMYVAIHDVSRACASDWCEECQWADCHCGCHNDEPGRELES